MYKSFNYNNEAELLEDINLSQNLRESRYNTAAYYRGGRDNKYGKAIADYNTEIEYVTSLYKKAIGNLEVQRLKELELWRSNKSNTFKFEIEKKCKLLRLQIEQEYEKAILLIKNKLEFDKKNAPIKDKVKYYGAHTLTGILEGSLLLSLASGAVILSGGNPVIAGMYGAATMAYGSAMIDMHKTRY